MEEWCFLAPSLWPVLKQVSYTTPSHLPRGSTADLAKSIGNQENTAKSWPQATLKEGMCRLRLPQVALDCVKLTAEVIKTTQKSNSKVFKKKKNLSTEYLVYYFRKELSWVCSQSSLNFPVKKNNVIEWGCVWEPIASQKNPGWQLRFLSYQLVLSHLKLLFSALALSSPSLKRPFPSYKCSPLTLAKWNLKRNRKCIELAGLTSCSMTFPYMGFYKYHMADSDGAGLGFSFFICER